MRCERSSELGFDALQAADHFIQALRQII